MIYYIQQDDQFIPVEIEDQNGQLIVRVKGQVFHIDPRRVADDQYSFLVNGQSLVVERLQAVPDLVFRIDQQEFAVTVLNERQKIEREIFGQTEQAHGHGEVRAPMPGLVLRIDVKVGDEVKIGQPLLIMEAMKMENEIRAPIDGVVKEIVVEPHQAVEKEDLLIRLE
ncbi:MAG: biotin/lipoyl-binding protein [Calditrichaeota bacterium]|nr:biotin/lipoyl-binding protein [Calditrichota bacterium]